MKRLILLVVLVLLAGIAGIVARSSSRAEFKEMVSHTTGDARRVIRESYELAPGAEVEVSGINGSVKIETSDSKTAEVYIERTASSDEDLERRAIKIEATANSLRIRSEKHKGGFFSRFFGSDASEKVTLKLPRQISLTTKGVNGPVTVGELDGSVEVAGVNGNIELQLSAAANADLETKGMNGRVVSDLPNVTIDKTNRGNYTARIGSGGNSINAKGVNGNIRLTRSAEAVKATAAAAGEQN